ncbi:hypothetical protein [Rufibacter sp. LB8]|uniref:hypothetical protein n=1 Tax=Rufibacter sp. LB8 TaxID=2777781 RepID=UPI00178C473D|nr:hypothetical protein [Rufibacter sp. LB8]
MMKRKTISFLAMLGLFLSFTACQIPATPEEASEGKGLSTDGQWLSYSETQCADPWGYCNKTPDKRVCVREYVENNGYTVQEISVTEPKDGYGTCLACTCPSGRVFKVKVAEQDVAKLLAVGFKKV